MKDVGGSRRKNQGPGAWGRPHLPSQASPNAGHLEQPGAGADWPHPAHIQEHLPACWCCRVSFALGWDPRCCDPDQMETLCAELGVGGRGPCELPVLGTCPCPPGARHQVLPCCTPCPWPSLRGGCSCTGLGKPRGRTACLQRKPQRSGFGWL